VARLPSEPSLLGKIVNEITCLETLAACTAQYALPASGRVEGYLFDEIHTYLRRLGPLLNFEPKETVRGQREAIGLALDGWKFNISEHFDGNGAFRFRQVEINRLREAGKISDTQNPLVLKLPHIGENFAVGRIEELHASTTEHAEQFSKSDHVAHPVQERRWIALLGFDIDGLIAPKRIHDHRAVQAGRRR
jgi:hypothetical protein